MNQSDEEIPSVWSAVLLTALAMAILSPYIVFVLAKDALIDITKRTRTAYKYMRMP